MTVLARRLGYMADAVVHAKTGPGGRFFTRERADEIALLLREAEKVIVEAVHDLRARAHAYNEEADRWDASGDSAGNAHACLKAGRELREAADRLEVAAKK